MTSTDVKSVYGFWDLNEGEWTRVHSGVLLCSQLNEAYEHRRLCRRGPDPPIFVLQGSISVCWTPAIIPTQ